MSEAVKCFLKNTIRPKNCCWPPVHHIRPVEDDWLWHLTLLRLSAEANHWQMIWLALKGPRYICEWRRQWTQTSLRWSDSLLTSSDLNNIHFAKKQKKTDWFYLTWDEIGKLILRCSFRSKKQFPFVIWGALFLPHLTKLSSKCKFLL